MSVHNPLHPARMLLRLKRVHEIDQKNTKCPSVFLISAVVFLWIMITLAILIFHAFCTPIRAALAKLPEHVEVIAEPGRFLIAPAAASITTVAGKAMRGDQPWYYLDDGVYGMFSGRIYDHARYPLHVFRTGPTRPSALVGPTCDSIDVIEEAIELPELEVGDLVVGRMMGAYTAATASTFNSLPIPRIVVFGQ
jgi:ornithine decarboxylase